MSENGFAGQFSPETISPGLVLAGRYRLESLRVKSNRVQTWRAIDQDLSRPVLVHLMAAGDERMDWVLAAARRAATVSDARFLRVIDAQHEDPLEPWSFLVCEHPVGEPLPKLLVNGPLSSAQVAYLGRELFSALAPIHANGIFHRRLSPDTIVITSSGQIKIAGLLIAAALRPHADEAGLPLAVQESKDLFDAGRVLYVASTARWPIPADQLQRPVLGLEPAEFDTDLHQGLWKAPIRMNRAIEPEVSRLIMALLRQGSGQPGPQLHTADEALDAFDSLASSRDGQEQLEKLVASYNPSLADLLANGLVEPDSVTANEPTTTIPTAGIAQLPPGLTQGAAQLDYLPEPASEETTGYLNSEQTQPASNFDSLTTDSQPVNRPRITFQESAHQDGTGHTAVSEPIEASDQRAKATENKPTEQNSVKPKRRWLANPFRGVKPKPWLVSFTVLVATISIIVLAIHGAVVGGSSQPAAEGVRIVRAYDFDPKADGGTGNENSATVHDAYDGDASTAWRTKTYQGDSHFGGQKPGVGVIFDFGEVKKISNVTLLLENQPNSIELRVPIEADPSAEFPPMESQKQWKTVAELPSAGLEAKLLPAEPVETRWAMVYFTNLPKLPDGEFRTGIVESYINR